MENQHTFVIWLVLLFCVILVDAIPFDPINVGGSISSPPMSVTGKDLMDALDTTADPCQDFFQYACGGWIKKNPIPESKSRWTQFDALDNELTKTLKRILEKKKEPFDPKPINSAKDLYSTCMDTKSIEKEGLTPILNLLNNFGGWPIAMSNWNKSAFSLGKVLLESRKSFGSAYLINVYNDLDQSNTSRSIIYIDQGTPTLARGIFVNPEKSRRVIAAYSNYIRDVAKFVRDASNNTASDSQIQKDLEDLLKFESKLANITTTSEMRRNNTRMYNPLMLDQIQVYTDQDLRPAEPAKAINWYSFIKEIYSFADVKVSHKERIVLVEKEYLKRLRILLDQTPARVLSNYVMWRLLNDLAPFSVQKLIDLQFVFTNNLYGTLKEEPRSTICVNQVNSMMGFAVSAMYVQEDSEEDVKKKEVGLMISHLKSAFKSMVNDSTWMDSETKKIAIDKVNAIREFLAYPDWIKNQTALESYYSGVRVEKKNYLMEFKGISAFFSRKSMKRLRQETDRTRWIKAPSVVNAFYSPEYNSITFPAAILQAPFFGHQKGRLAAMNYGGIGAVIGHEITHGFDDQGRQSDKNGNTFQWWTNTTLTKYLERAQCFIDQYSNYSIPSGTHLNGVTTQGENIADNGGLREAFKAYKSFQKEFGREPNVMKSTSTGSSLSFSPEQIFFLSYANVWCGTETPGRLENRILTDPHSPSRYRVIGPLSNNEDFAKAFHCPLGTPMNRPNKCILW